MMMSLAGQGDQMSLLKKYASTKISNILDYFSIFQKIFSKKTLTQKAKICPT
jgi:hypothetical protein